MRFEVIEAKPFHVGKIVRHMRVEHRSAIESLGLDVHRELRSVFNDSAFRKAWLIDGRLAALGGVTGSVLSGLGYVWLVLAQDASRHPKAIVREARRQLRLIMKTRTEIATTILPDDDGAQRLAIFLGFHVSHGDDGAPARTRAQRIGLRRLLKDRKSLHIPLGLGCDRFAIPMGYHERG